MVAPQSLQEPSQLVESPVLVYECVAGLAHARNLLLPLSSTRFEGYLLLLRSAEETLPAQARLHERSTRRLFVLCHRSGAPGYGLRRHGHALPGDSVLSTVRQTSLLRRLGGRSNAVLLGAHLFAVWRQEYLLSLLSVGTLH